MGQTLTSVTAAPGSPAETPAPGGPASTPDGGGQNHRGVGRTSWWLLGAVVIVGVGFELLVALDGSMLGRVARGAAVAAVTAAAGFGLVRGRGWVRAIVAFGIGCVAVAVGVGIGLPHLAKGGEPLVTIVGLVVLGVGALLLIDGAVSLLRPAPGWGRVVLVPVLLVAALVSVLSLGQAVAATNVAPSRLGSATPADRGFAFTDVELTTADGVLLSGWYLPSDNEAAVVLLHGAGSTRSDVLDHAVALAAAGYGVLMVDARGHGRSGGRAMDFGWYGDQDVGAAVSFLAEQQDVDPDRIAAVGLSMGGEEAIGAAATDPRIAAVVAEGATHRVAADRAWLAEEHGWRGSVQQGIDGLTYGLADLLTDASPPIPLRDAVRAAAPRPVLLIAGGATTDEAAADRSIQAGSPATVQLWIVDGAGHTGALALDPGAWTVRVDAFLSDALHLGGSAPS